MTAVTLPGLESKDEDRSTITFADHVDAIIRALEVPGRPAVLAVHSASGYQRIRSERPGSGADRGDGLRRYGAREAAARLDPEFTDAEKPLDWASVSAEENIDGLSEAQMATFRQRAVPVPGGVIREDYTFTNDARRDIPSTIIATGYTAADYQTYALCPPRPGRPGWHPRAAQPDLDRPAHRPLADVVEAAGDRTDHRRRRVLGPVPGSARTFATPAACDGEAAWRRLPSRSRRS